MLDTGKPKNEDKAKCQTKSRLLIGFVIVVGGIALWSLLHPTPVFRPQPEFPSTPLLYALDQHYQTINLQTGERKKAEEWRLRFYAPPDSPADILAAQAVIDVMGPHERLAPSPDEQWLAGWRYSDDVYRPELMLYDRHAKGRSRSLGVFYGMQLGAQVRWSADSQWIVFAALTEPVPVKMPGIIDRPDAELWLIAIPTGEIIRLTDNDAWDNSPSFSPDGTQIVYSTYSDLDPSHLYIMDLATGESHLLTSDYYAGGPDWSPDGQWIAFVGSHVSEGNRGIWIIRSDGTDAHSVIVGGDGYEDEDVEWLP